MKIERQNLLMEMKELLKDEFVAEISEQNGALILRFANDEKLMREYFESLPNKYINLSLVITSL